MRPIKADELRRIATADKLDALQSANSELANKSPEQRSAYIDAHGDRWSALRYDLWKVGSQKCWYSEVILAADEGEVEHFRPKKKVWKSEPPHGGYWWRAFDWQNFRLAHPLVNKRRGDYSSAHVAGKGCYFPLRVEANRAIAEPHESGEEPTLLDPVKWSECRLICFDANSGKPVPRYSKADPAHEWARTRAERTINFYHLDEGTWNGKRADLMRDVGIACDKAVEAETAGDQVAYDKLMDEILAFIDDAAEFSMAAKQMVAEKGLLNGIYGPPTKGFASPDGTSLQSEIKQ